MSNATKIGCRRQTSTQGNAYKWLRNC